MVTPSSLAAGNLVSIRNEQFQNLGDVLTRRIAIVGTYDSSKTTIVDNVPERFFSAGAIGEKYGYGSMLHRLALKVFKSSKGIETWVIPQPEAGGAVEAAGNILFAGTATETKAMGVYIAGEFVGTVQVTSGDTAEEVAAAVVALFSGTSEDVQNSPVIAAVNGVTVEQADITAKMAGEYGNYIDISLNLDDEGQLPAGITATITTMSAGATNPDIQDALDAMGIDDNQNEKYFTALVHGYQDSTNLEAVSTYNGVGNDFVGNFQKTVARPFRALFGDVEPGEPALAALIVTADGDREDRTNGVLAVPGSENHPAEIAALAMGYMENISSVRPEENYIDIELDGIRPGAAADRWTSKYDNRDAAVKNGISPTLVKNGVVTLQNVVSFYRPASVSQDSNGYRSMRNMAIIQNLLANQKANFEQAKWKGITIVEDVVKVSNVTARLKARDVNSVIDDLVVLARNYEALAWLFSASFTIDELKKGDKVILRGSGNGFDIQFPVVLSGEGGILNQEIVFDTSLAVFL